MKNLPAPDLRPEFYAYVVPKRLGAWAIDTVLILLLTLIVVVFTAFLAALIFPLIYGAINIAYRTVSIGRWSATPGMLILSIEFRDASGHRLDGRTALLHTLAYTACIVFFPLQILSIALILLTERGQSLGDHLLRTVVLNRPSER
jgi:uncharacterized RDD family membrane protein YckC